MRTEISALFGLQSAPKEPVASAHIGSGVYIQELESNWLDEVRVQCPKLEARERIEPLSPYTHRFFYELDRQEEPSGYSYLPTPDEKQLILRAILLSRIVNPTSIAYDGAWVRSCYQTSGKAAHYSEPILSGMNLAFVTPMAEDLNTITEADALVMAELWDSLQYFLDDGNEPQYRRIVRAIKYHEWAYSIWLAPLSHIIVHAALESMICTSSKENGAQVTQRLPALVSFPISPQQAKDIYRACCDFKHAAAMLFEQGRTAAGGLTPSDQRRADAVVLLRLAVRDLLTRAFRDRAFADVLAAPNLLRHQYPVHDRGGKLVQ
jgi:hypothetical protein